MINTTFFVDVPISELFRDSVISEIRQMMDTQISKGATLPFPGMHWF